MKLYQSFYKYSSAKKIADHGLGPFLTSTLHSFLEAKCYNCGQILPEHSIFGNSLTLDLHGIKLICQECRTGIPYHRLYTEYFYTIDRYKLLIELSNYIIRAKPAWIAILLGLRTNYSRFQNPKDYTKGFEAKLHDSDKDWIYQNDWLYRFADYTEPVINKYQNLYNNHSCYDCGAGWQKWYYKEKNYDGCCSSCGIPVQFQWFMRSSSESENKLLSRF